MLKLRNGFQALLGKHGIEKKPTATGQSVVKISERSKDQSGIQSHKGPFQEIKGVAPRTSLTIGPLRKHKSCVPKPSQKESKVKKGLSQTDLWVCLFLMEQTPVKSTEDSKVLEEVI